jgi:hypothetical protein
MRYSILYRAKVLMQACVRFLSGLKNASFTVVTAILRKLVKFQAPAGSRHNPEVENFS